MKDSRTNLTNVDKPKAWRMRLSSHSGTILLMGLIALGFLIACFHGGFPSVLLPSFIILAIMLLTELVTANTSNKQSESVRPLKSAFILVAFYLFFAWITEALLPLFSGPGLNKMMRKVEFPFSEASHVVAGPQGSIYVFSQFNKRIQKYTANGTFQFGWFGAHPEQKHAAMAIDENGFIYIYWDWVIRKFDSNGNMINEICKSRADMGWWRLTDGSAVWDPKAIEPKQYDAFNQVVGEGNLLPGTELQKTGFKAANAKYYRFTRLWCLFPVVSVERYLSSFERYIMPNPLSLACTFVFPGFLLYASALFLTWLVENSHGNRRA